MASKVFSIPEILEHILLDLDSTKDLLLAQRASKEFKATMAGSPRIQQALFFKPLSQSSSNKRVRINPLLCIRNWQDPWTIRLDKVMGRNIEHLTLVVEPDLFPPHASAWRMLLAQTPEHCKPVTVKMTSYHQLRKVYKFLGLPLAGKRHINPDKTHVRYPALDYGGESLGVFWARASSTAIGVVNVELGQWDEESIRVWIGSREDVFHVSRM